MVESGDKLLSHSIKKKGALRGANFVVVSRIRMPEDCLSASQRDYLSRCRQRWPLTQCLRSSRCCGVVRVQMDEA